MTGSFIFWKKWLFYTSLLFALFGLVLALFGNNIFFQPYYKAIAPIFWADTAMPQEMEQFRAFVLGPLGGTIACAYILLAYITWFPFAKKERWARNAIIVAFSFWAIVDSAVCIYYGVYFQVYIINAFSILQKALPIIFTWKDFKS